MIFPIILIYNANNMIRFFLIRHAKKISENIKTTTFENLPAHWNSILFRVSTKLARLLHPNPRCNVKRSCFGPRTGEMKPSQ